MIVLFFSNIYLVSLVVVDTFHFVHSRPLPDVPNECGEGDCQGCLIESQQHHQQCQLGIAAQQDNAGGALESEADSIWYVALYDFKSGGENQLSIRKGIF